MQAGTFIARRKFEDHLGEVMPGTILDRARLAKYTNFAALQGLGFIAVAEEHELPAQPKPEPQLQHQQQQQQRRDGRR